MLPIEDLPNWDREICVKQIKTRRDVIANMVGSLYPPILEKEIERIEEKIQEWDAKQLPPQNFFLEEEAGQHW